MQFQVNIKGLNETLSKLAKLPADAEHARKSALRGIGFEVRGEVKKFIQSGGEGWKPLSPLTKKFRQNKVGKWSRRTNKNSPFFNLGKFARYSLDNSGNSVSIFMGKKKKGKADNFLQNVAKRAEFGERIAVTKKARRHVAATRNGRRKNAQLGKDYFALKKTTTQIVFPKRPIFAPVFRRVAPKVPRWFRDKFVASLKRREKK